MTGLDVLADMMVNSQFPQVEVEKESGVILQELEMYKDQPRHWMTMNANTRYYGDNPYGWPIIGNEDTIQAVSSKSLKHHQKSLYTKDNVFIVIAGNILEQEKMLGFIEQEFAHLPEKTSLVKADYTGTKPGVLSSKLTQ